MKAVIFAPVLGLGLVAPGVASAQWGQGSSQQSPYGQPPASSGGSTPGGQPPMQAGGLAPPAPMQQDPESVATEEKLDTAEQKDSGRGLEWFYLNAEVGLQHLGLQTFKANHLVDPAVVSTTQTGPLYGAGLGVRLVFLTLGGRFRLASFSQYQVWTLDAEVGLRIPLGALEPYLVLGGGYASLGSFSSANLGGVAAGSVSVSGYDIRAGGGLDYYVTPVFSVGANLTGDLIGLTRPGVSPPGGQPAQGTAATVYAAEGSSLGVGISATAVLGLHF
jgi:hypothetical protein